MTRHTAAGLPGYLSTLLHWLLHRVPGAFLHRDLVTVPCLGIVLGALGGVGGGALLDILGGHDGGAEGLIHNVTAVLIHPGVGVCADRVTHQLLCGVVVCLTLVLVGGHTLLAVLCWRGDFD